MKGDRRMEKRTTGKPFFPFNFVMLFATFAARSCPEYQYKGDIYFSQRKNLARWNSNVPTLVFHWLFLSFLIFFSTSYNLTEPYNVSFYSTYSSDRQLPCSLFSINIFLLYFSNDDFFHFPRVVNNFPKIILNRYSASSITHFYRFSAAKLTSRRIFS